MAAEPRSRGLEGLRSGTDPGPRGPRGGAAPARHVHRVHRPVGAAPPRVGGRRQRDRRGDGRLRHAGRHRAARRRRLPGERQRPWHPGRRAPAVQRQVGGRSGAHHAPRGRQVRRGRLQGLGRVARRRRVGRERAVVAARARDRPRRQHLPPGVRAEKTGKKVVPGVPQGKLRAVAKSKRGATGTSITFWPDPTVFEEIEFRAVTITERLQVMAYLHRGAHDRLPRRAPGPQAGPVVPQRRRARRFREAPEREQGAVGSRRRLVQRVGARRRRRGRVAVEHRLPRGPAQLRQRDLDDRRRDARGGLQARAHPGDQPLTPRRAIC